MGLDHVTISGPTEVNEGSTANYTCTAYYDDSSRANVTASTTWSEDSPYAEISSSGQLTTSEVTSDQACQITASYGGKSDTHNVTIKDVAAVLTRIEISGPIEVNEESTANYTCTAYYDDSSSANVTASTTWSEDSPYAEISSSGQLTTSAVTSDQACQITASYGGKSDTHNVTIKNVATTKEVAYTLALTDVSGSPITSATPGQQFKVQVYADDLRVAGASGGIYAGYADLVYDKDLVDWVGGSLVYGPGFDNGQAGTIIDDPDKLVDEGGAFQSSFTPPGADPAQLLFTVTAEVKDTVTSPDTVTFYLNVADQSPAHDTLVYGSNDPVPISAITYGGGTLEVTVGWQNQALSEDANNNGSVEPLDALIIINKLNAEGFHELQHPADAYPNEPNGYCWDTNGDGWVAPIDALRVINYINNPPGGGLGAASRDMQDSSAGASIASVPAAITPVVVPRAGASGGAEKTISTPEPLPFASAVSSVGPSSSGLPSKRSGSAARSKPAHTSADVLSVAPAETASFPAPADPSLMERPLVLVSPQAGQVPAGSSSLRAAELEPECLVDVLAMARLELPLMA